MRFDHIVIHVNNDAEELQAMKSMLNANGYPFDPARGKRNRYIFSSNLNIGSEYIEIVRLFRKKARNWMPIWTRAYDQGQRGAFAIFIEVEDVERAAVALKRAGVAALGPAVLTYPAFFGLVQLESPYFIYYMPNFPGSNLMIALMQYKKENGREIYQAGMQPNAVEHGIHGIRRVEVALPQFAESVDMLSKIFPDLEEENGGRAVQLEKTRLIFSQSPDEETHVCLKTITSQKAFAGKKFNIDNVDLVTIGG